jgi:hypothetical protein
MRTVLTIVAAVLIVFGTVFTLQGIGLLGGSAMTGDRTWAVIGPILVVIGLLLALWAMRRGARSR